MNNESILETQRKERLLRRLPHLAFPTCLPKEILLEFETENTKTDKITFLLPFRGSDRLELLFKCIENLLLRYNDAEIIIIEEANKPIINRTIPGARYCFIYSKKDFNKSRCFNIGALIAKNNIICGLDCDMLIPSTLMLLNKQYIDNNKVVFPGREIYYVSKSILPDKLDENNIWNHKTWTNSRAEWQFHGGIWVSTKAAYAKVGGFDQRYFGYGSEDSSFYLRSIESNNGVASKNITLLHIEHDYVDTLTESIEINRALLFTETKLNPIDRINDCKKHNIYNFNE